MTTSSLFDVTASLRTLVWFNLRRMFDLAEADMAVTLMPPEQVTADVPTVNLHLYHASEDPFYRNAVGLEGTVPPIAGQPMPLRLFYVMTTHLDLNEANDPQQRQDYMGAAMKTLHDFPVIDDKLAIPNTPGGLPQQVMPAAFAAGQNRIEIALRNLEPEDNLNFWAAEDQKTPRLSAYYEVRAVFMEPERPKVARGTVFDVGLYVKAGGAARLVGSRASLGFDMPAATGLGAQVLDVVPARAVLRAAPAPAQERVRLTGNNLLAGDARQLMLSQTGGQFLIDPALNPGWDLRFEVGEISFIPQAVLNVDDGAGGVAAQAILPGSVEMGLEVISYRQQAGNLLESRYDAGKISVPLGVRVVDAVAQAGNIFRINLEAVTALNAAAITVTLAMDGQYYTQDTVNAQPAAAGSFVVNANHVLVLPHMPAPLAGAHPVQIFVNGAESQPFWIEA